MSPATAQTQRCLAVLSIAQSHTAAMAPTQPHPHPNHRTCSRPARTGLTHGCEPPPVPRCQHTPFCGSGHQGARQVQKWAELKAEPHTCRGAGGPCKACTQAAGLRANQVRQLAACSACAHLVTIKHIQQFRAAGGAPRLHGGASRAGWAGLEAAAHFLMPQQPAKLAKCRMAQHTHPCCRLHQNYTRLTVSSTHLEASGGQALAGGQRPHVPLVLHRHRAPPRLHRLQTRMVAT